MTSLDVDLTVAGLIRAARRGDQEAFNVLLSGDPDEVRQVAAVLARGFAGVLGLVGPLLGMDVDELLTNAVNTVVRRAANGPTETP